MGRGKAGSGPGGGRKRAAAGSVRPGPATKKRPGLRHQPGVPAVVDAASATELGGAARMPPTAAPPVRDCTPGGQPLAPSGRGDAVPAPPVGGTGVGVPVSTPGATLAPPTPPALPGRAAAPDRQSLPPSGRRDTRAAPPVRPTGVGVPLSTTGAQRPPTIPPAPPGRGEATDRLPVPPSGRRDARPAPPVGGTGVGMPLQASGVPLTPAAPSGHAAVVGYQPLPPSARRDAHPAPAGGATGVGVPQSTPAPPVDGTGVSVPLPTAPLASPGDVLANSSPSFPPGLPAAPLSLGASPMPDGPLSQLADIANLPVVPGTGSALLVPAVGLSERPSHRVGTAPVGPPRPRGGATALRPLPGGRTPAGGTQPAGRGRADLRVSNGITLPTARRPFTGAAAAAQVRACAAATTSSPLPPLSASAASASARSTDPAGEEPAEAEVDTSGVPATLVRHFAALHRRLDSQDAALVVLSATARANKETGGQCFDKVESLAASFDALVRANRTDMGFLTGQVKKLSDRGSVSAGAATDAVTPQSQSGGAGATGLVAGTQRSVKEVLPLAPWGAAIQVCVHPS